MESKEKNIQSISKEADFLRELYQEWSDRMNANPNMTIADFRSLFDEWEKPTLEPEGVTYKSDTLGGVDVIWAYPIGCDKSKVLIYTHGGGFAVGSSTSHRKLAGHMAKALGVSSVVLDYRRSPENPFPAQLEDCVSVYKALLDSGIKAKDIGTIGDSAGGNLAISSVLKFSELGLELPGCVIAFSPWLDMELTGKSLETNADTDALITVPLLEGMIDMYLAGDKSKARHPLANPLHADFKGFPPLYINAGGAEMLLDDAVRLYERAKEAGVRAELSVVEGMQHVFTFLAGRAPEADKEIQKIADWYRGLFYQEQITNRREIHLNKSERMNHFGESVDFDAVVVGAGFGGLYTVHKLRNEMGLNVRAYEKGSDVGGTWYWNRYPGALSDTESYIYRFSFDKELLNEDDWKNNYLTQPEILDYLNKVADRYDLRRSYQFNTNVVAVRFNEEFKYWEVTTDKGNTVTAKFLITGLGLLSATNIPNFKGRESFKGEQYHTGNWPVSGVDLKGKRVGVIGTGSTGIQVITAIAPEVKHLTVFQRTPQYSVPVGLREQSAEEKAKIKENYDEIWKKVKSSAVAFGFEESTVSALDVSEEERERVFEEAWKIGGGFRFMFGTFSDIATNPEANEAAAKFIRKKIKEIVKDPETARKLTPTGYYAKRPLCDNGYYETYNRDNVSLVDVKENPIVEITPKGIRTTEAEYELDVIIYATGFDAVDGNYTKIDMRGRGGVTMREKWADGPTGYLGMTNTDFPNLFMILGPNGPFTNLPPTIETQVEWITETIKYMIDNSIETIEPTLEAEKEWVKTCKNIADKTLFSKGESWIFGANIPGKKHAVMFYMGGLGNYRKILKEVGYQGFIFNHAMISSK